MVGMDFSVPLQVEPINRFELSPSEDKSSPSKFNRLGVEFWICQVSREKLNKFTTLVWSGSRNLWYNEFTTFGWSGSSNLWVSESLQVSDIQVSAS